MQANPTVFPAADLKLSLDTTFDFDVEESGIFHCATCSLWRGVRQITCPACRGRKRGHSRDFTCRLGICQCPLADEPFQPVREAPEVEVMHDEPVPLAAGINPPDGGPAEAAAADLPAPPAGGLPAGGSVLGDASTIEPAESLAAAASVAPICSCCGCMSCGAGSPNVVWSYAAAATATNISCFETCCVTKSISPKCQEAQRPEAKAAIAKEVANMTETHGVWRWEEAMPLHEAREQFPDAKFVWVHLLLGVKNYEDPGAQQFKARIVALGDQVRNSRGELMGPDIDGLTIFPLNLDSCRMIDAYAATVPGGVVESADVSAAYLQTPLRGGTVILLFPPALLPEELRARHPYGTLGCPCHKAIYGLDRSGFDWDHEFGGELSCKGWSKSPADPAVYLKKFLSPTPW